MKTLYIAALVASISVVAHAQSRTMADATYALKGPVRTFRTETATFVLKDGDYVEGPRMVQMEATFNRDGNRTDLHLYNDQGVVTRRIVMNFEGRRMTEAINYDGAGKMWLRSVNTYDNAGQIIERTSYHGDGSLRSKTNYKRNRRGQIIEWAEYSAQGVIMEQINNRYEGRNLHSSERKLYDPQGRLRSKELYVAPNHQRNTINYKPDGSVATTRIHIDQQIADYSADGSLQKSIVVSTEGRLLDELRLNKDGSAAREVQLPDEVDSHGNWTKQTKWFANEKGTRPLKVTYRTITYHQD